MNTLLVFWAADADQPFAVIDTSKQGIQSSNYATKTDVLEFMDESRLFVVNSLWGVIL